MKLNRWVFAVLYCVALVQACDYDNYFIAENMWAVQEPFVIQCISINQKKDAPEMAATVSRLFKRHPNVIMNVETIPWNPSSGENRKSCP
ncbi:MAG: hypothetical protein V1913_18165, partial [Fibrobacterota bacterium]